MALAVATIRSERSKPISVVAAQILGRDRGAVGAEIARMGGGDDGQLAELLGDELELGGAEHADGDVGFAQQQVLDRVGGTSLDGDGGKFARGSAAAAPAADNGETTALAVIRTVPSSAPVEPSATSAASASFASAAATD